MKDLYTINEFSKISGIETSTLRYWDSIGLFSPVKRDEYNNYRRYSLTQLFTVNFVTTMSDLDVPLKNIAELREGRNPESLLRLLELKVKQLDMELIKLREQSSIIHVRQELIRYGMRVDENEIAVMKRDDMKMILWPRNEYSEGDTFIKPLSDFIHNAGDYGINLSYPVGGYWDDFESFAAGPDRPDHFVSIDPTGNHIRKAGDYLVGFAKGYYGVVEDLPDRMRAVIREKELRISGPVYMIYLFEEISIDNSEEYLSQVIVSASRRR